MSTFGTEKKGTEKLVCFLFKSLTSKDAQCPSPSGDWLSIVLNQPLIALLDYLINPEQTLLGDATRDF